MVAGSPGEPAEGAEPAPMRLLLLSHTNAPWTQHYARAFMKRGDAVLVVTLAPDRIEGVDAVFIGVEPYNKYKNKHLFLTRVPTIRRLIGEFRPDLVFAPYLISNGLSAALAWRGPLVVSARGGDVLEQEGGTGWRHRLRERVVGWVCRRADAVHTVSADLTKVLTRIGVAADKIEEFPLGIDAELFHPDPAAPRPAATRLVCTRKHEPIYDIPTILQGLALLAGAGRAFHCTFVGPGHLMEEHQALAARLGLGERVRFTGRVEHRDLPAYLREADVYLSSSLSDGTSSSLLEAMAVGLLPVVSRIRANLPWVADGRTGLLFDVAKPESLAAALQRAQDDTALRQEAFRVNRARVVREADMRSNMRRTIDIFERVLRRRGVRP